MIKLKPSNAALRQILKDETARRESVFKYADSEFQSDPNSLRSVQARAGILQDGDVVSWITLDNGVIEMSAISFRDLARKMSVHVDKVRLKANEIKQVIDNERYIDPTDDKHWA